MFRNLKRGRGDGVTREYMPRGYPFSDLHFQKCSNFSIKYFFHIKISTKIFRPPNGGRHKDHKYAPVGEHCKLPPSGVRDGATAEMEFDAFWRENLTYSGTSFYYFWQQV